MSQPLFALLLGLLVLLGHPTQAPACSCLRISANHYLDQADLVFLGRAGKKVTRGALSVQPFTVLHLIKGKAARTFERVLKAGAIPPCHIEYPEGEVAVLFSTKGIVALCSGNFLLEAQLPDLGAYFSFHTGARPAKPQATPVEAAALEAAFGATLAPYLHDRPVVEVGYPPLAGVTLTMGKTQLRFAAKEVGKKGVRVTRALAAGAVRLVSGSYGAEGYSFDALLLKQEPKAGENPPFPFEVLKAFGRER